MIWIPVIGIAIIAFALGHNHGYETCEKHDRESKEFVDELDRKGLLPRG